ncbi:MAG: RHS repeat-associated core domain-containing protein [Candidatus Zixiibacteriota bacterium]
MWFKIIVSLLIGFSILSNMTFSSTQEGQSIVRKSGILSSTSNDPSNAGINTQCVNLYTGQHQETFELAGLTGRGGFGVSLALEYNGNVAKSAKVENRISQASYFGLGFTLGEYYITVDHHKTADIYDDTYMLIEGNQSLELIEYPEILNRYVLENGSPWIITRHVDTINQLATVTGWIIKHEDGAVYRYGDFRSDFESLNATCNILRYGNFVGNGVLRDDTIYANRWNLKLIHDPDSVNWIEFTYKRDSAYLFVVDSVGDSTTSANAYTRYSYLSRILASDSTRAQFYLSGRTDTGGYYGYNNYEYYAKDKVDSIGIFNKQGTRLTCTVFEYDYLEQNGIQKLILKQIFSKSGDGTNELPGPAFSYYESGASTAYGSISSITNSTGSIKEMLYDTISTANNLSILDYTFWNYEDILEGDTLSWAEMPNAQDNFVHTSENMFIVPTEPLLSSEIYSTMEGNYITGYWDGYWHIDTIYTYILQYDIPGLSDDGWIAYFDRVSQKMKVRRWMDGYWKYDNIEVGVGDSITGDYPIYIYPGDNYFVAVAGAYERRCDGGAYTRHLNRVYYYRWNGNAWVSSELYDAEAEYWDEFGVIIAEEFFYIPVSTYGNSCVEDNASIKYGYYDHLNDTVIFDQIAYVDDWSFTQHPNCAFGPGFYGYLGNNNIYYGQFNGSSWVTNSLGDSTVEARAIAPLANGVVWAYDYDGIYACYGSFMEPIFATSTGLQNKKSYRFTDDSVVVKQMWGSNHAIAAQYSTGNIGLWEWSGDSLVPSLNVYNAGGLPVGTAMDFSLDYYRLHGVQYFRSFNGYGTWDASDTEVLNTEKSSPFGYLLCNYTSNEPGDSANIAFIGSRINQFYWGSKSPQYFNITLNQFTGLIGTADINPFYCSNNSCFYYTSKYMKEINDSLLIRYSDVHYGGQAFKIIDSLYQDKPQLVVVNRVKLYEHAEDEYPIIQDYTYVGGMFDKSGLSPRFSKATVSLPYYNGDSPEGYSVTYFYNDLSDTTLEDGHYDSVLTIPDLNDFTINGADTIYRFGIENGGYHLDGMPFLTYSYSADSGLTEQIDYTYNYYKLYQHRDSSYIKGIYHNLLDSTISYTNGIRNKTSYKYDIYNLQPVEIYKEHLADTSGFVNYIQYGYAELVDDTLSTIAASMIDDNVLILPIVDSSVYNNALLSTSELLSLSKQKYVKYGNWLSYKSIKYRGIEDTTEEIASLIDTTTIDEFGNIYATIDALGDTTWVKYNSDKLSVIASSKYSSFNDFLVQDFEQPSGWDGWINNVDSYMINDTDSSFTGATCKKLLDRPSGENWGPKREISVNDLSDSLYYFTCWVRANYPVRIWCICSDASNNVINNGSKYKRFENLDSGSWQKIEGVFDLTDISWDTLDHVTIQYYLENADTAVARFDNFVFHPLDGRVMTKAYDISTGLVTASMGSNNIPAFTEYDSFYRPVNTKNFKGDIITNTEIHMLSGPLQSDSIAVAKEDPSYGSTSKTYIVELGQSIFYELNAEMEACKYGGRVEISLNNVVIDSIVVADSCDQTAKSGSFFANFRDTISVTAGKFDEGLNKSVTPNWDISAVARYEDNIYDPSDPAFVKSTTFDEAGDSTVAIKYYDSFGRNLQTRSSYYIILPDTINGGTDTTEATLVSSCKTTDVRGRVRKAYKPYYDIVNGTGVDDYTPKDSVLIEANAYYNGVFEADCDGRPFSEYDYFDDIKGREFASASPGDSTVWGLSARAISYEHTSNAECLVYRVIDQDSVVSVNCSEKKGRFKIDSSYYYDNGLASIVTKSYINIKGQVDSVQLFGTDTVMVRKYVYDSQGQIVQEYRVDYGWIRMLYDFSGRLRFMQNDKRSSEGNFVYYIYDKFGRKIEEGLCPVTISSQNVFIQDSADSKTFPSDDLLASKTVKYRWKYDYDFTVDSAVNYGAVVRVENADSSYYKEFHYMPFDGKDSTVVKLPIDDGDLKSIVHISDIVTGSMNSLRVYPHENSSGAREYKYIYDLSGRIESVREGSLSDTLDLDYIRDYVRYSYNASGGKKQVLLGVYDSLSIDSFTCQTIDYTYNPRGMMQYINNPDSVTSSMSGLGDHFALRMFYEDGSVPANTYYNGRVARISSSHSSDTGAINNIYNYTFNELSWLTKADYNGDGTATSNADREYEYNYLGNRIALTKNVTTTSAVYKSDTSSVLLSANSIWGSSFYRTYDTIGNLISIPVNFITLQDYDYRNLMDSVVMSSLMMGLDDFYLSFLYDESSQRIMKRYEYGWLIDCCDTCSDTVGGGGGIESLGLIGPGGDQCQVRTTIDKYYLYDGNTLLMVLDKQDNVDFAYINSPAGQPVAVYHHNSDNERYYFLKDQIGNTRVMVDDTGTVVYHADYHPFGEISASWASYNEPMKFTGKEFDSHGNFEYYYFGARYYDPTIGNFSSIDKAAQFSNGFAYCGNNPVSYIDPDGNLFFLSAPFLIGAALGGGSYAATAESFHLEKFLGYAIFGGLASFTGAALAPHSQIASSMYSSGINSMGGAFIDGRPASINLGFANVTEDGFSFANPFGRNIFDNLNAISGWVGALQDLNKIDYYQSTTANERKQTATLRERVKKDGYKKGETTYLKVTEEDISDIKFVRSKGDLNEFSIPGMEGEDLEVYRSKSFHLKTEGPYTLTVKGKVYNFNQAEIHFNKVPSRGLFGLGFLPHGIVDGNHVSLLNRKVFDGLGTMLAPIYKIRDYAVNAFIPYHSYRYLGSSLYAY